MFLDTSTNSVLQLQSPNQSITKIFFTQALENQKIVPTFAVLKIRIKL
jgi:hypothetical protein